MTPPLPDTAEITRGSMTPPLPDPDEITRGIMTLLLLDTAETTIDIRNAAFVAPQSATTMRPTVVALSEQFWAKNPTFPKDLTYLGHVLTLTLIILNRIKFFEEDKLVVFLGTVYLPYLAKEQKNNPLSLDALWHLKGYQDRMIFDEGSLCCLMLNSHGAGKFHQAFKVHLWKNCRSVVDLCSTKLSPNCTHYNSGSRPWSFA